MEKAQLSNRVGRKNKSFTSKSDKEQSEKCRETTSVAATFPNIIGNMERFYSGGAGNSRPG